MNSKENKSIGIRVLASVSSLVLIVSVVYVLIAGINLASTLVLVSAFGGLAGPAVASGGSVLECVTDIFEMFVEGIQSIFEAIAGIFSSIFG